MCSEFGLGASAGLKWEMNQDSASGPGSRQPVAFVPHGGGPWPFVDLGFGDRAELEGLAAYLRGVLELARPRPRALLVVSAHWEERVPTVMTAERPPMLFDYYGFPPESYTLSWPAPGDPVLAGRVRELLGSAGFESKGDPRRGYDHGTFVPLMLMVPGADIPTVQLSLKAGLDPAEHLEIGRALAPLRDEGVFIVGSGMTYHDLRNFFGPSARAISERFDSWLQETGTLDPAARDDRLLHWEDAPAARQAHPREEHLIPLLVCAGAAQGDRGTVGFSGRFAGIQLSAYHFGLA